MSTLALQLRYKAFEIELESKNQKDERVRELELAYIRKNLQIGNKVGRKARLLDEEARQHAKTEQFQEIQRKLEAFERKSMQESTVRLV